MSGSTWDRLGGWASSPFPLFPKATGKCSMRSIETDPTICEILIANFLFWMFAICAYQVFASKRHLISLPQCGQSWHFIYVIISPHSHTYIDWPVVCLASLLIERKTSSSELIVSGSYIAHLQYLPCYISIYTYRHPVTGHLKPQFPSI